MLLAAAEDLHLDLPASFMVGDRKSDLEAGHRAGCRASILVKTGSGADTLKTLSPGDASFVADDLAGAVNWILAQD